jgi:uncharacterized membrane protein
MTASRLTPAQFFAAYAVALVVMAALDGVWLGWLARDFYKHELGSLMTDSVRVVPAALYYVCFPAAVVYLALTPTPSGWPEALLRSAVMGLAAFGVYDLTNLAVLRGYTLAMTIVDMAWGTCASALGGVAAYGFVVGRVAPA